MVNKDNSHLIYFGKILLLALVFGTTVWSFIYTGGHFDNNPGIHILGCFGVLGTILAFLNVVIKYG